MQVTIRNQRGNALSEFAPALIVFVCFVMIPLIDIAFVPVRYFIAAGVVNECTHRLSLAEKRSESYEILAEGWWKDFLSKSGVNLRAEPKLKLVICGKNEGDKITLNEGQAVPSNWLPNGDKGPCVYSMELSVETDIHPLFLGSSGLPGFTSPIPIKICSRSNWENFGRNPENNAYYINE